MLRLLVVLVVLVGCGGGAREGADCSDMFAGLDSSFRVVDTCSGGQRLVCCRDANGTCAGRPTLTWFVEGACN